MHPADERHRSRSSPTGLSIRPLAQAPSKSPLRTTPNDYEMGLNHKLPFINVMTPDGQHE